MVNTLYTFTPHGTFFRYTNSYAFSAT